MTFFLSFFGKNFTFITLPPPHLQLEIFFFFPTRELRTDKASYRDVRTHLKMKKNKDTSNYKECTYLKRITLVYLFSLTPLPPALPHSPASLSCLTLHSLTLSHSPVSLTLSHSPASLCLPAPAQFETNNTRISFPSLSRLLFFTPSSSSSSSTTVLLLGWWTDLFSSPPRGPWKNHHSLSILLTRKRNALQRFRKRKYPSILSGLHNFVQRGH